MRSLGLVGAGGGRIFGPGEMRWVLLLMLDERPGHGYQLMTAIERRLGGGYQPSPGVIYPTLQQLEEQGLVRASGLRRKRTYRLTAAGRRELNDNQGHVLMIWNRAGERAEWGALARPESAEIVGPALRLAKEALRAVMKSRADPVVMQWVRDVLDAARVQIERGRRRRR